MSKADFEFYHIPGIDEAFVMPSPDCDPYRGLVRPENIGQQALDPIISAVGENIGSEQLEVQINPMTPDGYFFNQIRQGTAIVGQSVAIRVGLEASSHYYSEQMNLMVRWLAHNSRLLLMPEEAGATPDKLQAYREMHIEDFTALYDQEDNPTDPRIVTRQIIPIRAYRWLPGPIRKSPTRGDLEPTYSPRPVAVAIAQLVEITGCNPSAHPVTA